MQIDGTLSPTFKTAPKSDDYGAKNFLNIDEIIRNEYLNIVKKMLSLGINGLYFIISLIIINIWMIMMWYHL